MLSTFQNAKFSIAEALSLAKIAAALLDDRDRIVELNDVAAELLDVCPADVKGDAIDAVLRRLGCLESLSVDSAVYRIDRAEKKPLFLRVTINGAGDERLARLDDVSDDWAAATRLSKDVEIRNELMRQGNILMWSYDPDTDAVELGDLARLRTGHTRPVATLDWALTHIVPDDQEQEAEARRYVCQTGLPTTTTIRMKKLDGGLTVMRVHTVPGEKVKSGLYAVYSMAEDITNLVELREESTRNARRLEMALTGAKAAVFEVDLQTNGRWESAFFSELVGQAALERSREDSFLKYHDDDVERVRALANGAMTAGPDGKGGVKALDCRIYRPGEDDFWVRLDSQLEYDDAGKPIRVVGILKDINERKRQSLALADARRETEKLSERLQIALAAGRAGAFEYNVLTKQFWASPELHAMAPDAISAAENGIEYGLYHPDDRARLRDAWSKITQPDDIRETDVRLYRKDREDFWVRVCLKVDFDDNGAPLRVAGLMQDINTRKRQETEIIRAKMEAEAAAVAKASFLASMSHEIRTPLNGVLGMAQVLQLGNLQDDQREYVATITDCGKTLMSLLNDVLDISKIAAGKLEINPIEGDLAGAVGRVQQLFSANAREKGLELDLEVQSDLPSLKYDPVRVRQCLSNLVSNAIKFTAHGGVYIKLGGAPAGDGEYAVTIAVRDTGIGIEPAIAEKLFDPFTQADDSTTREYGGTDLGLSIARDLARLMGGDISVSSRPGEGAEFVLTFTCELAMPESADDGLMLPAEVAPLRAAGLSGPRVLLVDDNLANRRVARIFLRAFGAEIVDATNGVEAMQKIRSRAFDLVLLDMHMPVKDGREVIREIRNSGEGWSDVPIIALTAYAMPGDEERIVAMGVDGYVAKPIDQTEFNDAVISALARHAHAAAENERRTA